MADEYCDVSPDRLGTGEQLPCGSGCSLPAGSGLPLLSLTAMQTKSTFCACSKVRTGTFVGVCEQLLTATVNAAGEQGYGACQARDSDEIQGVCPLG